MKKIIAGLIGAMLLTGSVAFASNNLPVKHKIRLDHSMCTHCPKTSCTMGSKQTVNSDSKSICPQTANCVCPGK